MISECLTSTLRVRYTRPDNWYPLQTHTCMHTHSHTQLWRKPFTIPLPPLYVYMWAEQTNPHTTQCTAQTESRLPGGKLTGWPEGGNRLQSINQSGAQLWGWQSSHYSLTPVSSPNVSWNSVSLCMCVFVCVFLDWSAGKPNFLTEIIS